MIPLALDDVLNRHHEPYWRVEVDTPGGSTDDITDRLTDARLTVDATRTPRYTFTATVADATLIPRDTSDLLAPGPNVLRVLLGVRTTSGVVAANAAVLRVEEFTLTRSRTTAMRLTATSVESRISQAGMWQGELQPAPGDTLSTYLTRLLTATAGADLVPTVDPSLAAWLVPDTLSTSGDPWDAVEDVCRLLGVEPYVDRVGTFHVGPKPELKPTPDLTLGTGPDGTVTAYTSRVERVGAANRVRLVFRSTDPALPDRVGSDYVSTGPARWDGPLGRLLYTDTRDGPVSQTEADTAAARALTARSGLVRTVELQAAPDPRLEVGDTVRVRFLDGSTEDHVVTGVDRDLLPNGAMTVTTRGDYLEGLIT